MRQVFAGATLLVAVVVAACGNDPPAGPTPQAFVVSGLVSQRAAATTTPVPGARIEIVNGPSLGMRADADASGRYRLEGVPAGTHLFRASAPGVLPVLESVSLTSDRALDFVLAPAEVFTPARVVHLFTGAPIAGATVAGSVAPTSSDGDGRFLAAAVQGPGGDLPLTLSHPQIVARMTRVTVPGPEAEFRVIPSTFDLEAFDQLCRRPSLVRWVVAPRLIVIATLLDFTGASEDEYNALGTGYSDEEVEVLVATLTAALRALTGGTFPAFADVRIERPAPGTRVPFLHDGAITVARFSQLMVRSGFAGFGRRQIDQSGVVSGGAILVDLVQDYSESFQSHLRGHELGHTLGYNHVTATPSIMTSGAALPITPFDLQAGILAFSRPPGNRSPDIDPAPAAFSVSATVRRWSAPIW